MITVICGLIRNSKSQYFIARRASHKEHAGYWEFPGGKLEHGESHHDCLKRELFEELGMQAKIGDLAGENTHKFEGFTIRLVAYHCQFISATYELSDHDIIEWVDPKHLINYKLSESDIFFAELLQL
ncbi:MAG: (deoxy)nucleoside triphosphate pyrophosphohydrolase [Bacteroidota bacterium]